MTTKNYATNENGMIQRRVFAKMVLEMHENESEFHRKIITSDEAHFHFGGYVNKQELSHLGPGKLKNDY